MQFLLPQFNENAIITFPIHVDTTLLSPFPKYNIILRLDVITEISIIINRIYKTII